MSEWLVCCSSSTCSYKESIKALRIDLESITECPICHSPIMLRRCEITEKYWLSDIANDDALWVTDAPKIYPSIIAREYKTLHELCENRQPYGVLLSLKDNFETILKYEILLACAWIHENVNEEVSLKAISQLMTQNLSFGAWIQVSTIMLKEIRKAGYELPEVIPLENVRKFYENRKVVKWRNSRIGHGAMGISTDEEFAFDIRGRIIDLRDLLIVLDYSLRNQELFTKEKNANGYEPFLYSLTGAENIFLPNEEGTVYIRNRISNATLCLDPYVVIRTNSRNSKGVYFFENQRTLSKTDFLSYTEGDRRHENVLYFERLRGVLDSGTVYQAAQVDDEYLSLDEIRRLNIPQMSHDYVSPKYIINWLRTCFKKHEKGIFLLKMDRGTGKSVFTEKINCLYSKPEVIDSDIDVRTFHFGSNWTNEIEDASSMIEWQWKNAYEQGKSWVTGGRITDYKKKGSSFSQAFCDFLQDVRNFSERTRGCSRILMVFDGLDEIASDMLWSFIPEYNMIDKGVYFLLTSRRSSDLSKDLNCKIDKLSVQEIYEVDRFSKEHKTFLKNYLKKVELVNDPGEMFELIAKQSDHRTLFFGMLCKLIENGMNPEDLPSCDHIVTVYLDVLKEQYGGREAVKIREMLAALSTFGSIEPLSLDTLSSVIGEGGITLQLIGIIKDISPMLKVERNEKGDLYSIANADLADSLAKQIPETEYVVREIIELVIISMKDNCLKEERGLFPVSHNIIESAKRWLSEKDKYFEEDFDKTLDSFIHNQLQVQDSLENANVLLKHLYQFLEFRRDVLGEGHYKTISIAKELSQLLIKMGRYDEAIRLSQDLMQATEKAGVIDFGIIANKLYGLSGLEHFEEAKELSKAISDVYQKLLGSNHPFTKGARASVVASKMMNGEVANENDLLLMLDDYITTKTNYGEENEQTLRSLNNVAFTLMRLKRFEDSQRIYEELIPVCIRVLGEKHIRTIEYQSNLALLYEEMGKYRKSINLYLEVYNKQKSVIGIKHKDTIITEIKLFTTYAELGDYEQAEKYCKRAYNHACSIWGDSSPEVIRLKNLINNITSGAGDWNVKDIQQMINKKRKAKSNENYKQAKKTDKSNLKNKFEIYYQDCRDNYERCKSYYGEDHLNTLMAKERIAQCYFHMTRYKESIKILKEILVQYMRLDNPDDVQLLVIKGYIALNYYYMGNYYKALREYEKIVSTYEVKPGGDLANILRIKTGMVKTLHKLGRFEEAYSLSNNVYSEYIKVNGEDNYETLESQCDLADILLDLKKYNDALNEYLKVYQKRKKTLGEGNYDTLISLRGIILTYRYMGDEEAYNRLLPSYRELRRRAIRDNKGRSKHLDRYIQGRLTDL